MIVVNFATKDYYRPQQRLKNSLNGHKTLFFTDYQPGWPTHKESPYEFKICAIEEAFKHDDIVLWVDSSLWLVGDLSKIERLIINDGYYLEEAGHWVGSWTNMHTRNYFNLTCEEAQVPGGMFMFSAGFVGLNKNSKVAMDFFEQWKQAAKAGCFRGHWDDHRHDMSAGSIIAQRLGMTYQRGGSHVAYLGDGYSKPEDGVVFYIRGMA